MSKYSKEEIVNSVPQKGFFGHPKGLFTLFFTEFWERFSYYGMRAILLYYMYYEVTQGGLGLDQSTAASIMAIYGALVYMSGIIGGWVADRLLGGSDTIFYGGVLIMVGHIVLSLPGSLTAFFVSMIFIVVGTGLLKPNVSSVVGDMYSTNDYRRDAGFSIFYMGINLGAFLSPLVVGTVGLGISFHLGFALAAVGMFFGLITYMVTRKKNLGLAGKQVPNPLTPDERGRVAKRLISGVVVLALILTVSIMTGVLTINRLTLLVSILGIVIPVAYFTVMLRSDKTTADERSRVIAYIPLFIAAMVFWAIQEQGAIILAQYADQRTNLNFLGMTIQPAWFQSLNPLFIIFLAPVFAWLWTKLGSKQPTTPKKFSYGLIFAGLSFVVMLFPAYFNGTETLANPLWLVLSFFLVVIGELLLSPVGLSTTTKLAPVAFSSQTMSLWFLTSASGQAMNAQLVKLYNADTEIAYFGIIGAVSIVIGLLLYFFAPRIQTFMRGVN
ncbi:peptide ABC transporter permease [Pontibacillus halophilus JSM 076056 = DSM 19796]|uniref:Peptide ABC transporter permease n=1 Tax=Pontibacillus halophilus JSM 076056 = DSM 19796 TaxID=1385510 RepID=A0A0A5GLD3_9BACI|nr:peptide MFS transporter [Pontibacillus halophilus]KGX91998.1 peptide ABC transporter permease [Pontibacillus halophilus JSM 076056 = DSM 19796]